MKKLNKFIAVLVALAMMAALAVTSAFAAGQKATDEDNPATADYYKVVEAPTGTTVNDTFTFSFTQAAENQPATKAIENQTITITDADKAESETAGIDRYVDKNTLSFEDNFFPEVGVYEYTVKEVFTPDTGSTNTVTSAKDDNNVTKTTVYDTTEYTVKFGIAAKADGTTYVDSIGVYKDGQKVNAGDTDEDSDTNGFKFENQISKKVTDVDPEGKKDDEDGDNDNDALYVEKKVTDKDDKEISPDQEFSFTLTMKAPATVAEGTTETYAYQIMKADSTAKGEAGTITTGTPVEFKLAAGERLVLKNVSVGASYVVNEASYNAYETTGNMGETYAYITDNGNSTVITNKYDENKDPGTGLSMANLPFIVLALVAIGGLVTYVVVRRKADDEA